MTRKAGKMKEYVMDTHDELAAQQAVKQITQINISDKVLVGASQGIGNAILTTPLIKALTSMKLNVDILLPDEGGLLNGAERIFAGMENVKCVNESEAKNSRYLLGLQTMWPYNGMEKYVSQLRFAPNINDVWKAGTMAHEVEINMSLAYSLKYQGDIPSLYCAYNKIPMWNFPPKKNIGIHICMQYNHQFHANRRTWYQLEIGRELLERGHRVFIIGHEDAVLPEIRKSNPGFVYALGQPLEDIAGLIGKLDCMVSEDSGIMHVTAAMDTPQIAIFGPTSDVKNAPWSEKSLVIRKDIQCSPCQYTERAGNCYKNICMDIDVSYVVQHVEGLL